MSDASNRWRIVVVVAAVIGAIWISATEPIRLGLDLRGGTQIVLEARDTETVDGRRGRRRPHPGGAPPARRCPRRVRTVAAAIRRPPDHRRAARRRRSRRSGRRHRPHGAADVPPRRRAPINPKRSANPPTVSSTCSTRPACPCGSGLRRSAATASPMPKPASTKPDSAGRSPSTSAPPPSGPRSPERPRAHHRATPDAGSPSRSTATSSPARRSASASPAARASRAARPASPATSPKQRPKTSPC